MLLRSVRPGRYRLRNDGGGPSETALRPGVSRSSVRFPNARPSAPEKKPRRRRQRGARPDGLAAIGLGSGCQLRARGETPTRALRRWRIAPGRFLVRAHGDSATASTSLRQFVGAAPHPPARVTPRSGGREGRSGEDFGTPRSRNSSPTSVSRVREVGSGEASSDPTPRDRPRRRAAPPHLASVPPAVRQDARCV